jgi:hypothetical protein
MLTIVGAVIGIEDFLILFSLILCMCENPHNTKLKKIKRIHELSLGSIGGKLFK